MESTTEEVSVEDALAQFNQPDPAPVMEPPPDVWKTLPGGYRSPDGVLHRQAVVREMTGADEEQLGRIRTAIRKTNPSLTLQGGINDALSLLVERIGSVPMNEINPADLFLGDRTALLLFIREAGYGPTIELEIVCPHCSRELETALDITEDIETKDLGDEDTTFEVEISIGTAMVTYPTGAGIESAMGTSKESTPLAEINTHLLSQCILAINGTPFEDRHPRGGVEAAKELKARDRRTIVKEISSRQPGPQLEEVSIDCIACMEKISLPLDAFDLLFR